MLAITIWSVSIPTHATYVPYTYKTRHSFNNRNNNNSDQDNNNSTAWDCNLCVDPFNPPTTTNPDCVINLSHHSLTPSEHKLLSRGLNFCPTPPKVPDIAALSQDLKTFHVRIQRETFFHDLSLNVPTTSSLNPETSTEGFKHYKFRLKSSWVPPPNHNITALISCNERDLSEHIFPNWTNTPNISREERQAIRALKNNTSIIIKPADKGSAVVLLDRADYIAEGLRQLSDITFYTILDHCPTIEYHLRIDQYITTLVIKKELSDECAKYLRHYKPRTSQFYMLPKIHKPTRPPPGRPIISGNDSPTERISVGRSFSPTLCPKT